MLHKFDAWLNCSQMLVLNPHNLLLTQYSKTAHFAAHCDMTPSRSQTMGTALVPRNNRLAPQVRRCGPAAVLPAGGCAGRPLVPEDLAHERRGRAEAQPDRRRAVAGEPRQRGAPRSKVFALPLKPLRVPQQRQDGLRPAWCAVPLGTMPVQPLASTQPAEVLLLHRLTVFSCSTERALLSQSPGMVRGR